MLQRVHPNLDTHDLVETSRQLTELALRLYARGLDPRNHVVDGSKLDDPLGLARASLELSQAALANPGRVAAAQVALWWDYVTLAQRTALRLLGAEAEPVIEPEGDDRRFRHAGWDENLAFDVIKQAYLLTCLLYTSPSPRDVEESRMPSSA